MYDEIQQDLTENYLKDTWLQFQKELEFVEYKSTLLQERY